MENSFKVTARYHDEHANVPEHKHQIYDKRCNLNPPAHKTQGEFGAANVQVFTAEKAK